MKVFVFTILSSLILTSFAAVQTLALPPAPENSQGADALDQRIQDLVQSQSALHDRLTTRIMKLEEDIAAFRQDLSRRIAQAELLFTQEQTLIREYFDIINNSIETMTESISEKGNILENHAAGLTRLEQEIAVLKESRDSADEDFAALKQSIAELNARVNNNLSTIEEMQTSIQPFTQLFNDVSNLQKDYQQLSHALEEEVQKTAESIQGLEKHVQEKIKDLSIIIEYSDQDIVEKITAAQSRISILSDYIKEREMYAGGIIIGLGLLLLASVVLIIASRKRIHDINRQIENNRMEIWQKVEEQGATLDTRLVELLEKQIPLLSGDDVFPAHSDSAEPESVVDHTLAIVVGEEIYRIMKRRKDISEESPAFEELKTSLKRLWTSFRERGYEVVDLLGKKYNKDMEAKADFFLTHELLPGEQVVSRVIRPLIRHNGITIQKAEIEVQVGE